MAWQNTAESWGAVARTFHWGIAFAIAFEVPAGFIMSSTYGSRDPAAMAWHYWSSNVHHSLGLMILAFAILRVVWRLVRPIPDPITMSRTESRIATGSHWLLYFLMLVVPLSGWAALSALADSHAFGKTVLWFFGNNGFDGFIPRIVSPVAWNSDHLLTYSLFAKLHVWLLITGALLLTLHIAAALRHHFVLRNGTLRRMLHGYP
jgi:cytochrome b561